MKDHISAKERLTFKEPLIARFISWLIEPGYEQKEAQWRDKSRSDMRINAMINNLGLWGE